MRACAGGLLKRVSRHSSGVRKPYVRDSASNVALMKLPIVLVWPCAHATRTLNGQQC